MWEDEFRNGNCVGVFFGETIFVALYVGDSNSVVLVGNAYKASWPEVVFVLGLINDLTKRVHDAPHALTEV